MIVIFLKDIDILFFLSSGFPIRFILNIFNIMIFFCLKLLRTLIVLFFFLFKKYIDPIDFSCKFLLVVHVYI